MNYSDDVFAGELPPQQNGNQDRKEWLDIKADYELGHMKASKAYVKLRAIKSEIEDIIKEIEGGVVDELTGLSEDLIVDGNKISHVNGRATYQFKQSYVWNEHKEALKKVEEKLKQATKLKAEIVDQETGEIFEPVEIKQGNAYLKLERA